jgi:RNA polymerase sigma-70 factor (ECF subfamily)
VEETTDSEDTDVELMARLVAGDEEAFACLYQRWRKALHRFALGMTGSPAVADDVVQETFIVLMREAERYDASRGAVGSYLRGIARHLVYRCQRRESRFVALEPDLDWSGDSVSNPNPVEVLLQKDEVQRVHAALLALTPRLREVLVLCDLSGLSYQEAAETLGVPIGTIRSRLARGREALAARLEEEAAPMPAWKRALVRLTP